MSNILTNLITQKLINYLNYTNPYIELKSGIYKLCCKKISDQNLDYDDIQLFLQHSIINTKIIYSLDDYNEQLYQILNHFDKLGLNITIYFDMISYNELNIKISKIPFEYIYVYTPKILKYNVFKLKQVQVPISNIKIPKITLEMCKNCLSMLFQNDDYLINAKQKLLYMYDNSIVLDINNNVLDGKYKIMIIKFLMQKDKQINCIQLQVSNNEPKSNITTCDLPKLDDFLDKKYTNLLKFISDHYNKDIYMVDHVFTNEFVESFNTYIIKWILSLH